MNALLFLALCGPADAYMNAAPLPSRPAVRAEARTIEVEDEGTELDGCECPDGGKCVCTVCKCKGCKCKPCPGKKAKKAAACPCSQDPDGCSCHLNVNWDGTFPGCVCKSCGCGAKCPGKKKAKKLGHGKCCPCPDCGCPCCSDDGCPCCLRAEVKLLKAVIRKLKAKKRRASAPVYYFAPGGCSGCSGGRCR